MKPKAWSHSALSGFVTCPRQYHEVRVLKNFSDTMGEAALWGNRVHEALEVCLKTGAPMAPEFAHYQEYADNIRKVKGEMFVELELALDRALVPCEWFSSDAFVRGIVDVLHIDGEHAKAMDHKTGKRKFDSKQMKLMAILIFAHYPAVQTIKVGFFWLKVGAKDTEWFSRSDIPLLWQEFLPDLKQYRQAYLLDIWQPRQSGLCNGWCPVTSCEFHKPKR